MKVLVIGSGGREHALVWKIAQSPRVMELYTAPGNAGTAAIARNLDIKAIDLDGIGSAARDLKIDLVVVGPEDPLAAGLVDHLQSLGIPAFGPTKAAAEIEASKSFSESLMRKYDIPRGKIVSFSDYQQAREYVMAQKPPIVVKADGLAAGKGVVVAASVEEALAAVTDFMQSRKLGAAGDRVNIQEYLSDREMSAFVFTDSETVLPFLTACDYKRVYDADRGPNTGGMGSYSPPVFDSPALQKHVFDTIMQPAVRALAREGRPYRGVLYGGLMVNNGDAKVFEFNCRLGDPETQVMLPRLKTDIVEVMLAVVEGELERIRLDCSDEACVAVAMASGGYPGSYRTGLPVTGLEDVDKDVIIFHAGTKVGAKPGEVLTNGGRVLNVTATGRTIEDARRKVYDNITRIHFEGAHYRKDIALFQ